MLKYEKVLIAAFVEMFSFPHKHSALLRLCVVDLDLIFFVQKFSIINKRVVEIAKRKKNVECFMNIPYMNIFFVHMLIAEP